MVLIRNHLIDNYRKNEKNAAKLAKEYEDQDRVYAIADWNEPFGATDLKILNKWRPNDRIRLLLLSRLWHKVPRDAWTSWCSQEGIQTLVPKTTDTFDEWLTELSKWTGTSKTALKQFWYRRRNKLKELNYVQQIWRSDRG